MLTLYRAVTTAERRKSCPQLIQVPVEYVVDPTIGVIREKNTNAQNAIKVSAVLI